ncbi:hypothetical protein [uncultured Methanolobus sp.]|uniref:hypothetical protein n=1 Tax=uncultured Methanolobus sp. TaxID=218300 RepID=UPI0029C8F024|nr:hypothetical protein [uncultured Methanolobus sp.]
MEAKVRKEPETPKIKTQTRMPRTVEEKIIALMTSEGAITMPELYELSKVHDYNIVKGHLLRLVNQGFAEIDLSVDPMMYILTDAGEAYAQKHYTPTP